MIPQRDMPIAAIGVESQFPIENYSSTPIRFRAVIYSDASQLHLSSIPHWP